MDLSDQLKRANLHVVAADMHLQAKILEHQAAMIISDKVAIELSKADVIFAQDLLLEKKQVQSDLSIRSIGLDPDEVI